MYYFERKWLIWNFGSSTYDQKVEARPCFLQCCSSALNIWELRPVAGLWERTVLPFLSDTRFQQQLHNCKNKINMNRMYFGGSYSKVYLSLSQGHALIKTTLEDKQKSYTNKSAADYSACHKDSATNPPTFTSAEAPDKASQFFLMWQLLKISPVAFI